jgi:hypothetical protein
VAGQVILSAVGFSFADDPRNAPPVHLADQALSQQRARHASYFTQVKGLRQAIHIKYYTQTAPSRFNQTPPARVVFEKSLVCLH